VHSTFVKAVASVLTLALPAFIPLRASGAYFALPAQCTQGATGSDYGGDPLYGAFWPTVSIQYVQRNQNVYVPTVTLTPTADGWNYAFIPPVSGESYLVVATYTPFLQSYAAVWPTSSGLFIAPLPPAGTITHAAASVVSSATIQLTTAVGSNVPLPYGFLEMAPDFPGSSPYTLQADANGKVAIDCFTILSGGNNGTVSTPDGYYAYDASFSFSETNAAGQAVLRAR